MLKLFNKKDEETMNKKVLSVQEKFINNNFDNFIENDYNLYLGKYSIGKIIDIPENISLNDMRDLLGKCINSLKENNVIRQINLSYIGFSDGENVDYYMKGVSILPFSRNNGLLFHKITSLKEIKLFLSEVCVFEDALLPLFNLSSTAVSKLKDFCTDISTLNVSSCDNYVIDYFYENAEKIDFGFKINLFPGVGYSEYYCIGDMNIFEYNLKLVYLFLQKFYKYLMENDILVDSICIKDVDFHKALPFIFYNEKFLANFIAYNSHTEDITVLETLNGINVKECVLKALDINYYCYHYLPSFLKKDKDVCRKLISGPNFKKILPTIISNGPFSEKDVIDMFLEKLATY